MPEQEIHLDVAAYALGSLSEEDRVRFESHLGECERCRAELEALSEVADLLGEAETPPAPAQLRERTLAAVAEEAAHRLNGSRGARARGGEGPWARLRPRPLALAGAAAALAAAIAVVAIALPEGTPGAPTVGEAAALAKLPATVHGVTHGAGDAAVVDRAGSGVPFPNWHRAFGWKAAGGRDDALEGREATTTFYEPVGSARNVAYTIISGEPLEVPAGAAEEARGDRSFFVVTEGRRTLIAFERLGHTCVLSGEASEEELLRLAAWAGGGRVPF